MDHIGMFIWPLVGGFILYGIINAFVKAPGKSLQAKFVKLGKLQGKSKARIIDAVGNPNSTSAAPNGRTICQWMASGYHIALVFEGEKCLGVSHEFSQ